jgi:DNA primase
MTQSFVDFRHVKASARFELVLAHYGFTVTAKGRQKTILCPFHGDKTPSCNISLDKNVFHCFACGAKGNVLEFVAKKEGVDLRDAALLLADWCGIEPSNRPSQPESAPKASKSATGSKSAAPSQPSPTAAQSPVQAAPATPSEAPATKSLRPLSFALQLDASHPYLRERGLTEEEVATFGLGHCGRGVMKGRIAIPIHDADGNLVGYAGRWPGEPPEGEPKYRFPDGFEKSRVLFNLNRVSKGTTEVVLVEGFFGAIAMHALGLAAVACMGSSASHDQLGLLAGRGVRCLKILCDGDAAGEEASTKIAAEAAKQFYVRRITLPKGSQPDTAAAAIAQTGERPRWLEELFTPLPAAISA